MITLNIQIHFWTFCLFFETTQLDTKKVTVSINVFCLSDSISDNSLKDEGITEIAETLCRLPNIVSLL